MYPLSSLSTILLLYLKKKFLKLKHNHNTVLILKNLYNFFFSKITPQQKILILYFLQQMQILSALYFKKFYISKGFIFRKKKNLFQQLKRNLQKKQTKKITFLIRRRKRWINRFRWLKKKTRISFYTYNY